MQLTYALDEALKISKVCNCLGGELEKASAKKLMRGEKTYLVATKKFFHVYSLDGHILLWSLYKHLSIGVRIEIPDPTYSYSGFLSDEVLADDWEPVVMPR